jgi:chromosome segregation ATPase
MKRTPFTIALLNPANLAMLALTLAAGLCSAWWLAPVGLILWVVMMLIISREPSLQFSHVLESRAPLASRFQKKFEDIDRAQTRLFNMITSANPRVKRELQPVLGASSKLVEAAYALCLRLTPVENNRLVSQSRESLILQLENAQTKIEKAEDEAIRQEYQQIYDSIKDRMSQNSRADALLERVDATLLSLKNDLDTLNGKVVSIQSAPPEQLSQRVTELVKALEVEWVEIQSIEPTLSP